MKQDKIKLAHGSGGKLSHELVEQIMLPAFQNRILNEMHDGATLPNPGTRLAFTTDSFVIKPLFFAGGDIGKLAVCGTVNDLAMTGAVPLYLSAGFILEEGFSLEKLAAIVESMKSAAQEAGVSIVTGDTKVVEKGAADGIYINTAGIGSVLPEVNISPSNVKPGQKIILSGAVGEHAIAIMADRHGLELPHSVKSDCAPLNHMVKDILTAVPQVAVMRDPTRGGLAATLNEIALQAKAGIMLEEERILIRPEVAAVCDILGFDPYYLANEGKMLLFVEAQYSEKVLDIMRSHTYGREAGIIGEVTAVNPGKVGVRTSIGGIRLLDMPIADQLPRIC